MSTHDVDSTPRGIARHGQLPKPGPWVRVLQLVAVMAAVALVSGTSIAAIAVENLLGKPKTIILDPTKPEAAPPTIGAYPKGYNLMLVGNDTRVGQNGIGGVDEGARNDVTILLHVSADHSSATAISFPRDMIVPQPSCTGADGVVYPAVGAAMMNESLASGGLACTAKSVESLTGLKVQFAGLITFRGVIEMSNAVGGVPVCTTGPINDSDSGLHIKKAGITKLKGEQALAFLRTRHGIGDNSDLARISAQQVFLASLVRTLKSKETLTDIPKLYNIAAAATNNMTMSSSLAHPDAMVAIAQSLAEVPVENVVFVQYPNTTALGGIYENRVAPLTEKADDLFSLLRSDKPFKLGKTQESRGSVNSTAKPTKSPTKKPTATATPTAKPTPKSTKTTTVLDDWDGGSGNQVKCVKAG